MVMKIFKDRLRAGLRAAAFHLVASAVGAMLAAALVFGVWYPQPYRELTGGVSLFLLMVGVDLICGPVLTGVIFNPAKPRRELVTDIGIVVLIQLAALGYGLFSVAMARPVYVVYEVDRFQVVTRADVQVDALHPEQGGLHLLPWMGPRIIGVRDPKSSQENLDSLDLSLRGLEPSARPDWWQSYEQSIPKVLARAQPIAVLRAKRPGQAELIDQAVAESGRPEAELRWVPMVSFKVMDWVAFVDARTAEVLAFAHVDGF